MAITLLAPPEKAPNAIAAFMAKEELRSITDGVRGLEPLIVHTQHLPNATLCYPHVWYNLNDATDERNLQSYAWQFIYGDIESPISFEVSDNTVGNSESVAIVRGPALNCSVELITEVLNNNNRVEQYALKVLQVPGIDLSAIVLENERFSRSLIIPISDDGELMEYPLDVYLEDVRRRYEGQVVGQGLPTVKMSTSDTVISIGHGLGAWARVYELPDFDALKSAGRIGGSEVRMSGEPLNDNDSESNDTKEETKRDTEASPGESEKVEA